MRAPRAVRHHPQYNWIVNTFLQVTQKLEVLCAGFDTKSRAV
jgi:hypothetical protein